MIKFAVCDDQPQMAQELSEHLTGYMEEKRIAAYSVDCFSSGSALLGSGGFDVIFLDIQMEHPDGMETAKQLRRRGHRDSAAIWSIWTMFADAGAGRFCWSRGSLFPPPGCGSGS